MFNVGSHPATGIVDSIFQLRTQGIPLEGTRLCVLGYHGANTAGGGWFVWSSKCSIPEDGGTVIAPTESGSTGRWIREQKGHLNPQWFGALGDGTGRTPHDDRRNVESFDLATDPQCVSRDDSWDTVGLQRALKFLERRGGTLAIPSGTYEVTHTLSFHARGRAQIRGAGNSLTTLAWSGRASSERDVLFSLENVVGLPVVIRDLSLKGGSESRTALTLVRAKNIAGVTMDDCWFSRAKIALEFQDQCGDWSVKNCTIEDCGSLLTVDAGSWGLVEGNDFWQSTADESYVGIRNSGSLICSHNQFMSFRGTAIDSTGEAHVSGNYFDSPKGRLSIRSDKGIVADNAFSYVLPQSGMAA